MTSRKIHLHKLAPLIALATSRETYQATFGGVFDPAPIYALGVDPDIVTPGQIKALRGLGAEFEAMHDAWQQVSEYEDPPCPDIERLGRLIEFTKELGPLE